LSVDSTALNSRWNIHLPLVTSVDDHNWMYPIAFGFFESESKDSWTWFFQQLRKAIGHPPVFVICSDSCKGLTLAVTNVFPEAELREYFRHLMQNYIKQFIGKEHMYHASRAYKSQVYEHHRAIFFAINGVDAWLKEYHSGLWHMSGFNPVIKYDYITNNIAEVFNNLIKDHKDLPVCELVDKIRVMLMELFYRRRQIADKFTGKILPAVLNVLRARTRGLGHLSLVKCDHYCAEVQNNNDVLIKHVVKADQRYCSCIEWQHTRKPCQHIILVIIAQPFRDVWMGYFVNDYFSVATFKKCYARMIEPLEDRSSWSKVAIAANVGAPLGKRHVGRQRKNRIKGKTG
jgi:hypothetical protein